MYSCAEVVRMAASDDAVSASLLNKMRLQMHLAMCKHCSKFVRQLRELKQAARGAGAAISEAEIAEARARVLDGLLKQ